MRSPGWTRTRSNGPIVTGAALRASPCARYCRVLPRRSWSDQVTPLPHSGWARATWPSTRSVAATGLRHPAATF